MNKLIALIALIIVPGIALAGITQPPNGIPEPSTIALMGLGAVGVLAIALRGRRK